MPGASKPQPDSYSTAGSAGPGTTPISEEPRGMASRGLSCTDLPLSNAHRHSAERSLGFSQRQSQGVCGKFGKSVPGSLACKAWCADTRAIETFTVAGASVQAADVGTRVLVGLTVSSCGERDTKGAIH